MEKKYKPLNTTPNSTKEIKVKLIPAQREYTHSALQLQQCDYDNLQKSFELGGESRVSPLTSAEYPSLFLLAMEATGFLDALNSAPVPGIKIKKKKPKAVSPTTNKVCHIRLPSFLFMLHGFLKNFFQISKGTNPLTVFFSSQFSCPPQPCPFDGRPQSYSGTQAKPSSPETPSSQTPPHENQDLEQPGTPVPTEDPEAMDTSESCCV